MTTKVVGAKKAKVVKKVDQKAAKKEIVKVVDAPKAGVREPIDRICESCGKDFTSIYSGAKYCATCSADKKKARRKSANKRRLANRKDELNERRAIMQAIRETLVSDKTANEKLNTIGNILGKD